ncbi:MAG: hypothetical protein M9894_22845 [Planctomycetes bacterium]|nr:hypothetical protein [Planctomycetota bacterium]
MDVPRYLLRELLHELKQHGVEIPGLTDVPSEQIDVVAHSGYDAIRVRTGIGVFNAQLDWSMKTAPVITPAP